MNTSKNRFSGQLFSQTEIENGSRPKQRKMTFQEVLKSEHADLVRQIEWGTSDLDLLAAIKAELKEKTGYTWID
jgi:hypothetical protein